MFKTMPPAIVLALVMATAACTSGASEPSAAESLAPWPGGAPSLDPGVVKAADPLTAGQPLAAFDIDDAGARTVSRARIIVGDRCMGRFGFSPVPGWTPEGALTMLSWNRYGLWNPSARYSGYAAPADAGANRYPVRYLGPDATAVYFGTVATFKGSTVPAGGCQAEELVAVLGSVATPAVDPHLIEGLDREALARATQDARVVPRLAAWRSCMKRSGWDFADVQAPFDYWSARRGGDKSHQVVSDDELRGAATDLDCKSSTGLLGTWLAADIAYQNAIVERDGERLREYKQTLEAMVGTANTVISRG
jgi:hypothetical protein